MNPRELVDYIRSGPAKLMLDEALRFRRRTRSNPCDFNEFLEALRSSETIRTIRCESKPDLGISEDEWTLLKTLGSIKGIQNFDLYCTHGSPDFHPFQAVADAVTNAHLLHKLRVCLDGEFFPRDSSGLTALASALREHTCLQKFSLFDWSPLPEAGQSTDFDHVLQHYQLVPTSMIFSS
jgi:hypothetical protein